MRRLVAILSFTTDHFLVLAVAKSSSATVATDQLCGCEAQDRNRSYGDCIITTVAASQVVSVAKLSIATVAAVATDQVISVATNLSQPPQPVNYSDADLSVFIWKEEGGPCESGKVTSNTQSRRANLPYTLVFSFFSFFIVFSLRLTVWIHYHLLFLNMNCAPSLYLPWFGLEATTRLGLISEASFVYCAPYSKTPIKHFEYLPKYMVHVYFLKVHQLLGNLMASGGQWAV